MFRVVLAASLLAGTVAKEPLRWRDLPPGVQRFLSVNEEGFAGLLREIDSNTRDRLRRGEDEHLVYYVLQSRIFTKRPPIEPAAAARDASPGRAVLERIEDFLKALDRPAGDVRIAWWKAHLPSNRRSSEGILEAFAEAAAFLRAKEFEGAGETAYRSRGHSSDTSIAPSFSVWNALGIIAGLAPDARLDRVLIIGPGLDFAPRTGMQEITPPYSYQPSLTAHALLEWKLSAADRLEITSVDVNPRVLEFLPGSRRIVVPAEGASSEYSEYLQKLGRSYEPPRTVGMRSACMNVLTETLSTAKFDLVIATNILLYFDNTELGLAVGNVSRMLRSGGYFVHNELRPELENVAKAAGLPAVQGRTLEIAKGSKAPLVDAIVIHRRE